MDGPYTKNVTLDLEIEMESRKQGSLKACDLVALGLF